MDLPKNLLYATSARIGGSGLDAVAFESLKTAHAGGFLGRALAFGNRQTEIPASHLRTLKWHPVRLLSWLGGQSYYGAKKRALDAIAARELACGGYDLFHGWSGESLRTLREARRLGVPGVIEIPTWHRNKGKPKPARLTKSERERAAARGWQGWKERLPITRQQMLEEYGLADLLLVLSAKAEETFLAAGVPREKLFRHHRGVDVRRFTPPANPPEVFRAVFVGALIERKGVHHLLKAWRTLKLTDAELILAGTAHDEILPYLREYADGSVKVLGFVPKIEDVYRSAAVHVFPSSCEGSAKATYEAAACGLPQITTREAGDVVLDGVNGLIVAPDDPDAFISALRTLHGDRDLCAKLGAAGRERVVENFTWEHFRERLQGVPHRDEPEEIRRVRILALQLKRIGDLILTTPALILLKQALPEAQITLAASGPAAALLPAIPDIAAGIAFGHGRGWTPWQQVLTGPWDAVLDFTGTDRSALACSVSRAPRRITFEWVRKKRIRALAYNCFIESSVREAHTVDHYTDLLQAFRLGCREDAQPRLAIPAKSASEASDALKAAGVAGAYALIHPGTARLEKYWLPERWAEVIRHIRCGLGMDCVITGGGDPLELAHLAQIEAATVPLPARIGKSCGKLAVFAGTLDLLALAPLAANARFVVSCDTAVVHLAAAFCTPQVTLFGPTNPFHWRPRHPASIVLSAARPDAPMADFDPRMKGAPMDRLSTGLVIRATDSIFHRSAALPVS